MISASLIFVKRNVQKKDDYTFRIHFTPLCTVLIRKPPGPAETGHLTPRSRTTSASSASMMSPMSETRPSSETRLGLTAKQGIQSSTLFSGQK
jgi:hypothetical protein